MDGSGLLSGVMLAGAAVASVVYWLSYCYRPASFWKSVFKTSAVVLLAGVSVVSLGPVLVTAALLSCAVGDYLLSRDSEQAFLGGVGAFALGHLLYIIAIMGHGQSDLARAFDGTTVWVLIGLGLIMAGVLYRRAGDLRYAVLAYVPMVAGLGIAGLTMPFVDPVWLVVIGGLLFVFSDFVLALEMFVLRVGTLVRVVTSLTIWATYWMAQTMLLTGLVL